MKAARVWSRHILIKRVYSIAIGEHYQKPACVAHFGDAGITHSAPPNRLHLKERANLVWHWFEVEFLRWFQGPGLDAQW